MFWGISILFILLFVFQYYLELVHSVSSTVTILCYLFYILKKKTKKRKTNMLSCYVIVLLCYYGIFLLFKALLSTQLHIVHTELMNLRIL